VVIRAALPRHARLAPPCLALSCCVPGFSSDMPIVDPCERIAESELPRQQPDAFHRAVICICRRLLLTGSPFKDNDETTL
jgi:hypothetical protein